VIWFTRIRDYQEADFEGVFRVYVTAFADEPWNEYSECKSCGQNYGIQEVEKLKEAKVCKKCGTPLGLKYGIDRETYCRSVIQIIFENLGQFWTEEKVKKDLKNALNSKDPVTIIAENSELVGLLWGYRKPKGEFGFLGELIDENSFYMDDVAVSADRRREKIGTRLCQEFERKVWKVGGNKIFLRTKKDYEASTRLYEKLGYSRTGIFDPEYPDREYFVKSLED